MKIIVAEPQPVLIPSNFKGMYRVCETNPIYECGWIFVSNLCDIDEAIRIQEEKEKQFPKMVYTIVAV